MKKIYKKVMFGAAVIAACLTFAFASCNPATGGGTPDNDPPPNPTPSPTPTGGAGVDIGYTAAVDGGGYIPSTKINFVFDDDVAGLTVGDITIGGTPGSADKGTLTRTDATHYSLAVTTTTAGAATVSINKAGIDSAAKNITLTGGTVATASPDLSIKFGIISVGATTTDKDEVTDTFNAVHAYLATKPAVTGTGSGTKIGDIALGDYVDLVSLSIAAYPAGQGELNNLTDKTYLRLIVVGINSFREGPDKDHTGSYADNGSPAAPHLVFQFQNIPANHRMNATNINNGGYAASEMRKYLVNVGGVGGSFLAGLKDAGVPDGVLWAPKRYVATGGNQVDVSAGLIEDKL